jgi:hypothetical protein
MNTTVQYLKKALQSRTDDALYLALYVERLESVACAWAFDLGLRNPEATPPNIGIQGTATWGSVMRENGQ